MPTDETEIMSLLRALDCIDVPKNEIRALRGSMQYGPLDIDEDTRDFVHEALEELIDARFYLAAEAIRIKRFMRVHSPAFEARRDVSEALDAHVNALMSAILTVDATMRDISQTP